MNAIEWLALWFVVSIAACFLGGSLMRLNHIAVVNEDDRVSRTGSTAAKSHPLAA
jgi:4-hydroxybenzoate polyprenyltransferase